MAAAQVPESVLARIWNDGWRSRDLRTTDGRRAAIIYRGVWTHSNGPDFRDAMLELDGRLVSGAVELHVRSSQWHTHGHHLNPEYDAVVLHVVLDDDAAQHATGPAGRPIPTIAIGPYLHGSLEEYVERFVPLDLGRLGETACLPTLAGGRVDEIRIALRRAGWRRLHEKQLRFQQEMAVLPPSEVLYRGVLDSLGLSANRPGMAAVADGLALDTLDRILASQGETGCLAALLGVAGFLPLSPDHLALIEGAAGDEIVLEES